MSIAAKTVNSLSNVTGVQVMPCSFCDFANVCYIALMVVIDYALYAC